MATQEQVNTQSPQSMTQKTLSAPVIVGGTIGSAALTGCTADTPTVPTSVATKQYVDSIPSSFTTGDVKLTLRTVADSGFVLMNDSTIGNAASGATGRANADTEPLFTLLWNNILDAWAPVSGGRGANAAADFAANKTLALPKTLGRALACFGTGSGLTARALGENLGEQAHAQTSAELAVHSHSLPGVLGIGGSPNTLNPGAGGTYEQVSITGGAGSATPFNIMQPTSFVNVMVKL